LAVFEANPKGCVGLRNEVAFGKFCLFRLANISDIVCAGTDKISTKNLAAQEFYMCRTTQAAESIRERFLKQIRNSRQITTLDAAQTTEFVNLQKSFAHRLA
jgi:hypothetical protein